MARLLVVEDEADIALVLRIKFGRAGYDVTLARDGAAGVAAATTDRPDVMLLDVMLPKLDGYQVCRAVKGHYAGDPAAPLIVMLSARSQATDRQRGIDAGCDDYVLKPFRPADLLARVDALLAERGRP